MIKPPSSSSIELVMSPHKERNKSYGQRSTSPILVAAFFLGTLSGCTHKEAAPYAVPAASQTREIKVTRVISKILKIDLKLPGEILPYRDVRLYSKIPGFIQWIGVDRGSIVNKGQLLCVLSAPEWTAQKNEAIHRAEALKAALVEAQKKLESARAQRVEADAKYSSDQTTFERMQHAFKTPGLISKNELNVFDKTAEASRAVVRAREEAVEAAQAEIISLTESEKAARQSVHNIEDMQQYLHITAPFDGVITERDQHEGSFVYPPSSNDGLPILRIKEISLLRIVVPVPEIAVEDTRIGDPVNFTVVGLPAKVFAGRVTRIAHSLDERTRSEPIELTYQNSDWKLSPGMFPEIIWPMKRTYPTLFVPISAVTSNLMKPYVIRIANGKSKSVDVKRGQTMGDLVEVFGDLKEGDFVAVHPDW